MNFEKIKEKEVGAYDFDFEKERTVKLITSNIKKHLDFETVLDLGCGRIKYFNALRVDGNTEANCDILFDLEEVGDFGLFDLVWSIETAEHVANGDNFVENLTKHAKKWIVMTACPPTDSNPYSEKAHLNEQPKQYWIDKVTAKGFDYQKELTEKLQKKFRDSMIWFSRDLMIFKRHD